MTFVPDLNSGDCLFWNCVVVAITQPNRKFSYLHHSVSVKVAACHKTNNHCYLNLLQRSCSDNQYNNDIHLFCSTYSTSMQTEREGTDQVIASVIGRCFTSCHCNQFSLQLGLSLILTPKCYLYSNFYHSIPNCYSDFGYSRPSINMADK